VSELGDAAIDALEALDAALERSSSELQAAHKRVRELLDARGVGQSWREIVEAEERPLVVESLSTVLDELSVVGSKFRRTETQALYAEGLSMERIANLFGVTRQRVSALLRERNGAA
jgi:transcriptional regulator with XRE-family HTH domain